MATGMCRDERGVDCLVLYHNKQNREVLSQLGDSAWHNVLSGYRELLLKFK